MATPKERIEAQLGLSGLPLAPIPREQPEVPDHELLRRIGLGSYGEVWLARNVVGQYRAVKVVYRDRFSDERPYEREFSGIQKYEPLSRTHQGLVQVLQIGRKDADGYFYYVMELADDAAAAKAHGGLGMGEFGPAPSSNFSTSSPTFFDPNGYAPRSLQHDLKLRGRLPAEDCVQLGLSLSLALGHLHRHGLIHRDVKPSNIIFVNGISKLADIGLVTEYAGANSFVGTEGFIPPEGPNSPQADLYGLGKVLYEASMGKDRQDFPEPFTALAVQEDSLALLELNAVVLRACATDIRERYQSAEEMHVDLALLQSGDSVRQKQALERRLARLKRVSTIGAAVTLVVTAAFLWQQHETRQMKKLALQNSDLARKSDQVAAESRKQLVKLQVANGIRQMEDGNLAACLPWFAEVLGNIKGDSSSEATYRLLLGSVLERCPKLVHVFQVDSPPSYCSFSPNGRTLACRLDSGVTVLEVTSGRVLFHIINANAGPPFFSPDGQRLIIGKCKCDNSPSWGIYDANTGGPIGFKQEEVGLNRKFLDSIDGSHVLLSDGDRTAQVFDLDTGESTSPAIQAPHRIVRGRFAKNQRYVALASTEQPADAKWEATETTSPPPQNLGVWDALTGQTIGTGLSVDGNSPVLLETDGRHVAVKAPDWTDIPGLRVFDTSTGQQVQPVPDLATDENFLISSHGQWVAGDHLTTQTRLWNFATGQTLTLNCPADFGFISFSADGLLVATSRGKGVTVWNAKTGEALLPLLPKGRGLALSADGHLLAICGLERALCIWDLASVRKPELAIRERDKLNDAVYSPDGRKLITLTTSASSIRVWDALTGKPLGPPLCDGGPTVDLKFSRNGQQFATFVGPGDRKRRKMSGESGIWIVKIGEMTTNVRLLETDHIEFDADFSPDGERIVTAGGYGAKVWDAKTDKLLLDLDREGKCLCAAFSPDGKQIVTSGESGVIRFWDATTGACLRKLERSKTRFETIAFSPDWHRMAVGASDETMQVVDSGNFAPATTPLRFSGGSPLRASFGPDGESLITFGPASFVLQWGIRDSGLRVPPLDYGQGSVVNAEFSPNGKFIVSCSDYGSTRVWNSAAGEPVIAPINNGSKNSQGIYTARFSPSGDRVITAGEDCVARVWAFHPCEYSQSQLTQLAQIMSGQRLDSTGTLLPTDPKDIQTRFEELRVSLPHAFQESTAHEQAVWHEQMATEAARVRLWPSVIWHVDHAIKLDQEILQAPTFDEVIRLRGQAHAELGHWLEAQADFKLAVQLSPEKIYNRYDLMLALVAGGCTDEYQKEWNAAFTNFEWAFHRDVKQIRPAWGIVSVLIHSGYWGTNTTQNVGRAIELGWMLTTNRSWGYMKSALLYRAGSLDKALEFAGQTRANVSPADETEWLILAMIHAKVGHPVEARKFLNEAGKVWEQKVTKPEGESPDWWDRTEYQAMRQEAEAALEQSARASNRAG